jgi:exodeoxyribonuclease V alpha subunit
MKTNQGGTRYDYQSCHALMPFSTSMYRATFTVEQVLSKDIVLLSTLDQIKGSLDGFSWYQPHLEQNFVRAAIADTLQLEAGKRYAALFSVNDETSLDTPIKLTMILAEEDLALIRPVRNMMQSWRMNFLDKVLLNTLYKSYGEQTFMMINHKPAEVAKLLRLDSRRMLQLSNEAASLQENWHKLVFFISRNLKMQEAELIVDLLNDTVGINKKINPFEILANRTMSSDLRDRFFTAFGIYEQCKNDLETVMADFLDVQMGKRGETAIWLEDAIKLVSEAFNLSKVKVERTIHKMINNGTANYRKLYGKDTISMGAKMQLDILAAECLSERVDSYFEHDKWVERFEISYNPDGKIIELADEQKVAIQTAVSTPTSVITGGPGVGKTTTVKSLIAEIRKLSPNGRIYMAAPTGKAARRMAEVTGEECSTLHRMMGMTPDSSPILSSFQEEDTLILDECSLMDINLLTAAVKHSGKRGRVIFIGDPNQIESLDTGAILNDMIACRHMTTAELIEVQRQAAKSAIVKGSYDVLAGIIPEFDAPGSDLHHVEANTPEEVVEQIKHLVEVVIPQEYGIEAKDIQILSAMRKKVAGAISINYKLKQSFNPKCKEQNTSFRNLGNVTYHVGDRVMQEKNRYDLDIQNGEVGTIVEFDERKRKIVLDMGDRTVLLPYDNYLNMTHAWAKTIHKSQGSEYQCVIISMPSDHEFMLNRNMLFTGMTRGKAHVFVVSSKLTLELAVKNGKMENGKIVPNNNFRKRLTHLPFLLSEAICAKSEFKTLNLMAQNSRSIKPPKPVHTIDTDSIYIPF